MDPSNNFSSYRSCLKAAMWRSEGAVTDKEKVRCYGYFNIYRSVNTCQIIIKIDSDIW